MSVHMIRLRTTMLVGLLNYSTSAAGSVQVEIQDAAGNPLPGFRLADCQPLVGDQIETRSAGRATRTLGHWRGSQSI
jgi:hypothetical protein